MHSDERRSLRRRFRIALTIFIFGLVVSGVTAFPLRWELDLLASAVGVGNPASDLESLAGIQYWIAYVRNGLHAAYQDYPFLGYGTDWLAFAHLAIAVFFIGPLREPEGHDWILKSGLITCFGVFPLALICGPIREIPFYWRLLDCSFGLFGSLPLLYCLSISSRLNGDLTRFDTQPTATNQSSRGRS